MNNNVLNNMIEVGIKKNSYNLNNHVAFLGNWRKKQRLLYDQRYE